MTLDNPEYAFNDVVKARVSVIEQLLMVLGTGHGHHPVGACMD